MEENRVTGNERPDYLSEILAVCTTLSTEAIDAAEKRARGNEFNVDRGEITFAELAINLNSARDILRDSIDKRKLMQLPITVQKELLIDLQAVARALQGLMNNADEIVNLDNSVEALNTAIWKYGLHNLSDQVLGYQAKLNQLKQQEVRIKNLLGALENAQATAEKVTSLAQRAEGAAEQVGNLRTTTGQEAEITSKLRKQAEEEATKAATFAVTAAAAADQSQTSSASAKTAISEISPIELSIKGFFNEIDTHRRQMAELTEEARKFLSESTATLNRIAAETTTQVTSEVNRLNAAAKNAADAQALALTSALEANRITFDEAVVSFNRTESERTKSSDEAAAGQLQKQKSDYRSFENSATAKLAELETNLKSRSEETIEKNQSETRNHLDELKALKESVKEQLAQATGLGQFGAFQSRQNKVASGKYFWVGAVITLAIAVVVLTGYIAAHAGQGDLHSAAFWIKISMNIPLGFLITFCSIQYNRERRLEEEYAFKASISVSLTPYRELIYSILEKEGNLKDGTYTSFVIDAVRNVFSSPTERIFDPQKSLHGIPEKALKNAAEIIGTAVKAAK
jgi:hypothetical protein